VNDIRPMELGKTWDPCRIRRKLVIVVVGFLDEVLLGYSRKLACFQGLSLERFWGKYKPSQ